jgi:hypothetical protein
MYDAKIEPDGRISLRGEDIQPVEYSEFVSQKIYKALMNMPMDIVTGTDQTKPSIVINNLQAYLNSAFSYDMDIDPAGVEVELNERGNQRASLLISYTGESPEGALVHMGKGYSYDINAGVITSVDFEPRWLEIRENSEEKAVTSWINVPALASEIELPLEPVRYDLTTERRYEYTTEATEGAMLTTDEDEAVEDTYTGGDVDSPITPAETEDGTRIAKDVVVLCELGKESLADTVEEREFTIETEDRLIYPVGRYTDRFVEGEHILLGVTITSVSEGIVISGTREYGDEVIILHEGTGTISGTSYVITAKYASYVYRIKSPMARKHVYKLRPNRGKYFAMFDKTIKTGNYVLKYKASKEGR